MFLTEKRGRLKIEMNKTETIFRAVFYGIVWERGAVCGDRRRVDPHESFYAEMIRNHIKTNGGASRQLWNP